MLQSEINYIIYFQVICLVRDALINKTLEQYATENGFKFDELIEDRISGTSKLLNMPKNPNTMELVTSKNWNDIAQLKSVK